jgi:hypothetical protein
MGQGQIQQHYVSWNRFGMAYQQQTEHSVWFNMAECYEKCNAELINSYLVDKLKL